MTSPESHSTAPFPHGPWMVQERRVVYRDPWIRVVRDEVTRPDGTPGSYCVVHLKPGVSVIAVDDQGNVHLTQEFHYGVGRITLEAVSGGVDEGESPDVAARRELVEELGIEARTWIDLGVVDPFTANVVSPTRLYLALGLSWIDASPEGTEQIERISMPLHDAVQAVLSGQITHAPSCLALLRSAMHLGLLGPLTPAPRC